MCCSVLRVVRSNGYLSIPLNISGALFWKCASPDDKSKFNPHIYHPQLAIAVHACRVRRKEGNYEEIKWRAIVRCPSTGQNNTGWQEMKECQNAATELLFAPNGFPVEANIKNAPLKMPIMYDEQTSGWQQQHVAADCYLLLQCLLFVAMCWDQWAQSIRACEMRYGWNVRNQPTNTTFYRYTGVNTQKIVFIQCGFFFTYICMSTFNLNHTHEL